MIVFIVVLACFVLFLDLIEHLLFPFLDLTVY